MFRIKLDQAKEQFKGSVEKVDKQYKDMVNALQVKIDKHHKDQIELMKSQKAQIDGEIKAFFNDMLAIQKKANASKLEELEKEL